MLTPRFSRAFDVWFKTNEIDSNLFVKLDISRVTRLLRASNLASSSSIFERCSVSLLSHLSLEVLIWRLICLEVFFRSRIIRRNFNIRHYNVCNRTFAYRCLLVFVNCWGSFTKKRGIDIGGICTL